MADHDQSKAHGGAAAAAAAAPAPAKVEKGAAVYFDVVAASSAAAASSPIGRKRPRGPPTSNDDDDEQPAERQCAVSVAYAATARRGRSPAKSAMVSIDNLLRAAQKRGSNSDTAAAAASTLADGGGDGCCETECERALSWRDDALANAVMRLPKVLPQWAIADPRLYAARTKTIADEEEEEENNNDAGGEGAGPSRRNKRAKAAKTRDPRQPKKARSAYNIFVIEFHEKIKAEQQQKEKQRAGGSEGGEEKKEDNDDDAMEDQQRRKFTEVGRKMGQQWKDLPDDDRRKYDDLAAKDKGRYATEMEVYTATKQKEEAEMMKKKEDAAGATGAAAAAISTKSNDGAKAAAAGGTNEQHPKGKLLKTPTANRLVSGNRSADGGVLGSIGSGGGASSSSPTKRIRTPAKLLTSVPAPDIGEGWTIKTYQRQTGSSAGHTDSYWYSPALGKKFRSLKEIGRFKQALARVQADAGGAALDAAHAERLAWKAFKHATAGDKK